MSAHILDGKALAENTRADVARDVAEWVAAGHNAPGLATILVGEDPASNVYVSNKRRQATSVGIEDFHLHLPSNVTQDDVANAITEFAGNPRVSGILLQLPVPEHLDSASLIELIPANKDVDGLTTESAGLLARGVPGLRPCTPAGIITMLDHADVNLQGANVVVVGRSQLVGYPVARLLTLRDATVTVAHSRTKDLTVVTRQADIVIAAAGVPHLLKADHIQPGAVVIDVGIHRTRLGLRGDVDFEHVEPIAGAITPVPGGVGPMTIATLLQNTMHAAKLQHQHAAPALL